ncbi:hypothetical protein K457DRAFT_13720 [Linnemannia elongata AG-77]|uniref:COPI associated n=1 Tax=Linnemannia elongata AG-77 TaxID=1314771 RepID=A0A197KBS5_9FUNG|nr:hypothetical protein K457DRAFT_13720 [Linnemannia elongata AG-77]
MLRLGRRGIILSLFVNSLNIALYLIILVASCFNIIEASVNFIILNVFAASFACLLVVSEIRLPQLTYEYFRFLCTYRGRGLTYLFFGCLIASPIPFNLYGGIIVVCMGLAFFMLSYVSLIPPLDSLILNYKKLDQWKEQKHFRVQLEAQRIYEQQLQQEQNLTRMIPAHHPNSMTVHAHMAMGSPKQIRAFSAINAGSALFNGTGGMMGGAGNGGGYEGAGNGSSRSGGGGGGGGSLTAMFSPPISPTRRMGHHPLSGASLPGQQHYSEQEVQFPRHQPQSKLHGSVSAFLPSGAGGGYQTTQQMAAVSHDNLAMTSGQHDPVSSSLQDRASITRSKGCHPLQQEQNMSTHDGSTVPEGRRSRLQSVNAHAGAQDKSLPSIITSGVGAGDQQQNFTLPATFALSPPPNRRWSNTTSVPGSPLQYLCVNNGDSTPTSSQASDFDNQSEAPTPVFAATTVAASTGNKTELKDDYDYASATENAILKSSSQHQLPSARQYGNSMSRRPDLQHQQSQHQLPLRTTNKPTPPHDPFRKTSLSGVSRAPFQSHYQPPEPPLQGDMSNHPLPQQPTAYYHVPAVNAGVSSIPASAARISPIGAIGGGAGGAVAMTATGRILSSIGGMSGCYGIIGGVPQPAMMMGAGLPTMTTTATYRGLSSPTSSSKQQRQQLQHQQQQLQREQQQLQQKQRQLQQQASSTPAYGSGVFHASSHQPTSSAATSASTRTARLSSNNSTNNNSTGGKRISDSKVVDFQSTHILTSTTNPAMKAGGRNPGNQHLQYMPDIVLTLPTPADNGLAARKEEYFAM